MICRVIAQLSTLVSEQFQAETQLAVATSVFHKAKRRGQQGASWETGEFQLRSKKLSERETPKDVAQLRIRSA
jgi:hypothetical protein